MNSVDPAIKFTAEVDFERNTVNFLDVVISIDEQDQINCKTKSVLYLLQSRKNPSQYAGQTGATIGTRTMQHGGDIDSEADKPVSNHFKLTGSSRRDLKVTPFMRVKNNNPWVRLHLERLFINKHNLIDDGINAVL